MASYYLTEKVTASANSEEPQIDNVKITATEDLNFDEDLDNEGE